MVRVETVEIQAGGLLQRNTVDAGQRPRTVPLAPEKRWQITLQCDRGRRRAERVCEVAGVQRHRSVHHEQPERPRGGAQHVQNPAIREVQAA